MCMGEITEPAASDGDAFSNGAGHKQVWMQNLLTIYVTTLITVTAKQVV